MTNRIALSIKEAYPNLSDKEVASILDGLLEKITAGISAGGELAFVRPLENGNIELVTYQIKLKPTNINSDQEVDEFSSTKLEQVKLKITAPKHLTIDGFINLVVSQAKPIDFIYFLLYFVAYGSPAEVKALCEFINKSSNKDSLQRADFYKVLKPAKTENLLVISVHYGSPLTFDLLGIGSILEASKDLIKDVSWRASHEKKLAELERKNKRVEIEKAKVEITAQKLALEKAIAEIVLQKIEILERLNNLPLSDAEKKLIVSAMLPKLLTLIDKKPPLLLGSGTRTPNKKTV